MDEKIVSRIAAMRKQITTDKAEMEHLRILIAMREATLESYRSQFPEEFMAAFVEDESGGNQGL